MRATHIQITDNPMMESNELRALVRNVPDFPEPEILFAASLRLLATRAPSPHWST